MDPMPSHLRGDKRVFLDTCVIQFLGDKNKAKSEAVSQCLATLSAEGYLLTISEITFFENLHGLWGKKAVRADTLLRIYKYKEITRLVLFFAACMGGLYHDEKIDGIDMGDKIIAATAVIEKGFVLTANHKDFPSPFFLTEKIFALPYLVGHYTKTLDLVLYKPNIQLINRRIVENDRR